MEFISQKEFDAFINSLGNGVESSEISDFQNLFAQQNDFSSSVLAQSQSPFNDQKRDTVSNVPYPAIASPLPTLPNIQGHHALANSLDFDLIQANPAQQVIPNLDTQNYIQPYPTPSAAYANELFGNSDVSSPDHSLSDSNYAYSSSGPSSPDSNAISNAPSSPEVQYISSKQNFNQPPFTPMFGVPANYGMDEQRAYDSSSPQMRKPFVKQEKTDLMEELEARVGWANSEGKDDKSRKKPRDNSKESQQEKHKSAEKQRRSNMNELLERLKTLLPNAHTAEVQKMTKLNILAETVDYVVKLQDLCKELIQENKQLKGQLERGSLNVPSAVPTAGPVAIGRKVASTQPSMIEDGASKKRKLGLVAGVQQYVMDGSRAIFLSVFFLMVIFSPYADHSHGISEAFEASGQPRVVLNDGPQTVIPPSVASGMLAFTSLPFLTTFLFNFLKWGVLVIAGFAFMVWGDRSISTKSPNFALAKEEMEIAHVQILSGQFSEVEDRCRKALELLDRVPPRSYFMALLLTVYQLWRHIMHRFLIGIYIEQIIAGLKGTEKEYADLVADVCSLLLKSWYKAPPNVEWLYICLDAINTARVFVPHKVIGLTASSTFRIRGNTGMAFRMWEIYIDWGLRSLKDSLVDTSLEQKHLFYSAEGSKHLVQGELVQAKASFKKSLDISSLIEDEKLRFFIELKTVGMFGMMFMLEQRWEEAMQAYKVVTKHAEARSHKAGLYWGVVGLCTSLVHLKQVEKAKFVRKYFMAKYPNFLSASENPAVPFLAFDMDLAEGKYIKAMEKAEIIVKNIKETSAYCTVHSMTHFLVFGESVLALWEESLAETSSLRTHSSKLSRMSHETCTVVYKVACANPVMQPRALILKGQYYFLLKNYAKAKYYWTNAVETARKLQMTADEKVAIERLSNSQLEIKDDCHHKACIEKLVSTLTQQ